MSYISLHFSEVKIQENRALEAIQALVAHKPRYRCYLERWQAKMPTVLASVESGEETAIGALMALLTEEYFTCSVEDGFLDISGWAEDGDGKSSDEEEYLAALGPLFEAGGYCWGSGDDGQPWEYRFAGGGYELAWVPHGFYVSKSDTALATAAAGRLREAVAGNEPGLKALAEVEAFLMAAGLIRDPEALGQVS